MAGWRCGVMVDGWMDAMRLTHYYWLLRCYLAPKRAHYYPFFKARVPAAFEGSSGLYAALLAWRLVLPRSSSVVLILPRCIEHVPPTR